jgi:hypothetical protein
MCPRLSFFQGLTFLSRNLYGSDIKFQNSEFAVLSLAKLPSDFFFGEIRLTKLKDFTFLSWNLYGRYPKDVKIQNFEYEVHQVGPKDSSSQNFSYPAKFRLRNVKSLSLVMQILP